MAIALMPASMRSGKHFIKHFMQRRRFMQAMRAKRALNGGARAFSAIVSGAAQSPAHRTARRIADMRDAVPRAPSVHLKPDIIQRHTGSDAWLQQVCGLNMAQTRRN